MLCEKNPKMGKQGTLPLSPLSLPLEISRGKRDVFSSHPQPQRPPRPSTHALEQSLPVRP